MVQFLQHGEAIALQTLDEPDFPQRLRPVEPATVQEGGKFGEGLHVARRRHGDAVDVPVDAVLLVLDPVRHIEPERDFPELPAELRDVTKALLDECLEFPETEIGRFVGTQDHQPGRVLVAVVGFGIDEEVGGFGNLQHDS